MPNSDIIACSPRSDLVHCLLHRAHAAPRKGLWFSTWPEAENLQQTMGLYGFIMVYMGLMDWFQNVEGKHMDKLYTKPWLLPLIAEVSDFLVSCSHHTILGSIGLRENMQQNHILLQQTPFLSCRFSMIFPSTQWEQWMYSAWWCQLPGPILVFKTIFQNTDGQLSYIEHI
jgi:hypothetical protein